MIKGLKITSSIKTGLGNRKKNIFCQITNVAHKRHPSKLRYDIMTFLDESACDSDMSPITPSLIPGTISVNEVSDSEIEGGIYSFCANNLKERLQAKGMTIEIIE